MPEAPESDNRVSAPRSRGRMRRKDIEDVLGEVPMPDIEAGWGLVNYLFEIGPIENDSPIRWQSLESWMRITGIELHPWQSRLIVEMSKAYLQEMHESRHWNALAPWPPARNMWKYVKDQQNAPAMHAALDEPMKEKLSGTRKRH